MNASCHPALRYELSDGNMRCVVIDPERYFSELQGWEADIAAIDPSQKGLRDWMKGQVREDGTLWWHDVKSLQDRYRSLLQEIARFVPTGRDRVLRTPVVIGGDWEFNAWACPAGDLGEFIMVNPGFVHCYSFAAMFLENTVQSDQDGVSEEVASSMVWMTGAALGRRDLIWDNLALPITRLDAVWEEVQHPSQRLGNCIAAIDAFAMLHECGHVALGHLDELRTWRKEEELDTTELRARHQRMQELEFEADKFACQGLVSAVGGGGGAFFEPLVVLFTMLRIGEAGPGPRLASTHPPAAARYRSCLATVGVDPQREGHWVDGFRDLFLEAALRRLDQQSL
jgi:hypothetical protein